MSTTVADHPDTPEARSERDRSLDDLQALLDWLRTHPGVPVDRHGARIIYSILGHRGDVAGLAELSAIAEAAGVLVTDVRGRPVQPGETHHYVQVACGTASYEAAYVTREEMASHEAHMTYRDNVAPDSTVVVDGEVVEPLAIGRSDA